MFNLIKINSFHNVLKQLFLELLVCKMGDDIQGSVETVPKDLRQLRACLVCSLVKTFDQVLVIN